MKYTIEFESDDPAVMNSALCELRRARVSYTYRVDDVLVAEGGGTVIGHTTPDVTHHFAEGGRTVVVGTGAGGGSGGSTNGMTGRYRRCLGPGCWEAVAVPQERCERCRQ